MPYISFNVISENLMYIKTVSPYPLSFLSCSTALSFNFLVFEKPSRLPLSVAFVFFISFAAFLQKKLKKEKRAKRKLGEQLLGKHACYDTENPLRGNLLDVWWTFDGFGNQLTRVSSQKSNTDENTI